MYGLRELRRLASLPAGAVTDGVRRLAAAALAQRNEWMPMPNVAVEDRLANTPLYPKGRSLTADLRQALVNDFRSPQGSVFLYDGPGGGWVGVYIDLNGSRDEQFVLFRGCLAARVYQHRDAGWHAVGTMTSFAPCHVPEMEAALRAGSFEATPQVWKDLKVGDHVYHFQPTEPSNTR